MARRNLFAVIALVLVLAGCGRKLPPSPPEAGDPATITGVAIHDGVVVVSVTCNVAGVVSLVGKTGDDCPQCTDGLALKDEKTVEGSAGVTLEDRDPEGPEMVYRVRMRFGRVDWLSPPRLVMVASAGRNPAQ